jgi:hypothetical protein
MQRIKICKVRCKQAEKINTKSRNFYLSVLAHTLRVQGQPRMKDYVAYPRVLYEYRICPPPPPSVVCVSTKFVPTRHNTVFKLVRRTFVPSKWRGVICETPFASRGESIQSYSKRSIHFQEFYFTKTADAKSMSCVRMERKSLKVLIYMI